MHILILGASGMVGRKLTARLIRDGHLNGQNIARMTLVDVIEPQQQAAGFPVACLARDISQADFAPPLIAERPDVIFHLAAIVSGEAEENFDKGYAINLDGVRFLLEAIRAESGYSAYRPRLVFTSSIAVFGAPFDEPIADDFLSQPLTSYGTQKAIGELLLSDYSRKGFVDGLALRLPTICVRPGKPNLAASGFFSNIIREPLVGLEAVLPVSDDVMHWHASPRAAVGFLLHAAALDTARVGPRRALTLPGLAVTVAEQIAALKNVAGQKAVDLIRRVPDARIAQIVAGWPRRFHPQRTLALGFQADASFEEIIRIHIEDELGGKLS
jgi:D-erythronate 2-dehydrogenase